MAAIQLTLPARLLAWCGANGTSRRQPCKPTLRAAKPASPSVEDGMAALQGWQEIERGVAAAPIVSAALFRQVNALLKALKPPAIERGRLALLLDLIGSGQPVASLLDGTPETAEWRLLFVRCLNEAEELGLVTVARSRARLSLAGRERLNGLHARGFTRDGWLFVERCLRERLEAVCSSCVTPNRVHWHWDDFECRRCSRHNRIVASPAIMRPALGTAR